jgi:hypothetical protein
MLEDQEKTVIEERKVFPKVSIPRNTAVLIAGRIIRY